MKNASQENQDANTTRCLPKLKPTITPAELSTFLEAGALIAAHQLIGCTLERTLKDGTILTARIIETEAYTQNDPASHSANGISPRNKPMFGPAGTLYVYISYGMHHCMNVVTGELGQGEAVLLRALQPITGIQRMVEHRNWQGKPAQQLLNGPGKICQAFAITKEHNTLNLLQGNQAVRLYPRTDWPTQTPIQLTPRIGISKAVEWKRRFVVC